MKHYKFNIAIIGAGSAGLSVASAAAQLGLKVALVEKGAMGGDCLNYGCVPSKALVKSAKAAYEAEHLTKYGLKLNGEVVKDWNKIKAGIQKTIDTIKPNDSQERFEKLGVKVFRSEASFLNSHTLSVGDGIKISAKIIVIAVGADPFVPPITGLDKVGYLTNENIFTLNSFPKRLLVIGSGPIGCEIGQAFQRLGSRVSMVSRADTILAKEDPDMSKYVESQLKKEGMVFHYHSETKGFAKVSSGIKVMLNNKNKTTFIVDKILVATGRRPSINKLSLEMAGVNYTKRGISVDKRLKTSQKNIYAIGDCNGLPQFTHSAGYQAGIVVRNAIFHIPSKYDLSVLPWATYTDPVIATVGYNEFFAHKDEIDYQVTEQLFKHVDRAITDGKNIGKVKVLLGKKGKILGATIVGQYAGENIHEFALAMTGKIKAPKVAQMIHAYPTFAEANKQAINNYYSPKLFSPKVRSVVRFLNRL